MLTALKYTIKKQMELLPHRGTKVTCPFCGFKANDLYAIGLDLPVLKEKEVAGAGKRNAGCYNCHSTDRERLVYIYLRDCFKLFLQPKSIAILHIAPEKRISEAIIRQGFSNYVCGDKFTPGYSYPTHVKDTDITALTYTQDYFDIIICNHVLEHVPNDSLAMRELFRVLKPGGTAILQVPISKNSTATLEDEKATTDKQREAVYGQFDHVRLYGVDYKKRLADAGFSVQVLNLSTQYGQYGLSDNEDLYVCTKAK